MNEKEVLEQIVMEQIEEGATVWGVADAEAVRELQKAHPDWVDIISNLAELGKITGEKYDGSKKCPYFGAMLTSEGKKELNILRIKANESIGEVPVIRLCERCGELNLKEKASCGQLEGRALCPVHFKERHKSIHVLFLAQLDINIADYMKDTGKFIGDTTLFMFVEWAGKQAENPTQTNSIEKLLKRK